MYAHLSNARRQIKRLDAELHVIAVVFNPIRFISRYNLFESFRKHAEDAGAKLWVVELAFGDRPFEVADPNLPRNIALRTDQELWHKECMINEAVARLPHDWKYVAWVDADVTFINPDWVQETIQQLQHYPICQMFTHAVDLGPNGEPMNNFVSFGYSHLTSKKYTPKGGPPRMGGGKNIGGYYGHYWHPGFGWAYTRSAWDTIGGLLDINVTGGGDYQMAYGLLGRIDETIPAPNHPNYFEVCRNWQKHALRLERNFGAVPSTIVHHWHGRKSNRGYHSRWKILTDHQFDPLIDLRKDWQRMYQLAGNKPGLRDDLRAYFRMRNEDGVEP